MKLAFDDAPPPDLSEPEPAAPRPARTLPAVSIVVPVRDEVDNVAVLAEEIARVPLGRPFEAIFVDDGSMDGTGDALAALARRHGFLRVLAHDRSAGQSAAIRTGALAARAPVVMTIDGDGQNDPAFFPDLLAVLDERPEVGLVAGERARRKDTTAKRLASRAANAVRRRLLDDDTRDTGCGLKAIRREVYLALPFFDGNHRYLPALVKREGHAIAHVPVVDRPRAHGRSKYGILDRALVGLPDILGVLWLKRRRRTLPHTREL